EHVVEMDDDPGQLRRRESEQGPSPCRRQVEADAVLVAVVGDGGGTVVVTGDEGVDGDRWVAAVGHGCDVDRPAQADDERQVPAGQAAMDPGRVALHPVPDVALDERREGVGWAGQYRFIDGFHHWLRLPSAAMDGRHYGGMMFAQRSRSGFAGRRSQFERRPWTGRSESSCQAPMRGHGWPPLWRDDV